MIINVNPLLLTKIAEIEALEREAFAPIEDDVKLEFFWLYAEDGNSACGESYAWRPHARYSISVAGEEADIYRDKLDKYFNDGWQQHPLSSDYEPEED